MVNGSCAFTARSRVIGHDVNHSRAQANMLSSFKLWRGRRGRVSALRIATLGLLVLPIALALTAPVTSEEFSARPVNDLIHRAGYWALMFVIMALAITPLRRIARWPALIALRLYLTIGFVALLGLTALAATSTDAMVRRLGGRRWQRLHQLIYVIVLLALIHFFQQTKADVWVPTFFASLVAWLLGYRLVVWRRKTNDEPSPWILLALTLAVCVLTFVCEAVGIAIVFNTSPWMVLQMAF